MPANKFGRHPDWNKATVIAHLKSGLSIADICTKYSIPDVTPRPGPLRNEVARWRKSDPVFDQQVKKHSSKILGGRPSSTDKDPSSADWRTKFCLDLFETRSRLAAAERSPYEYLTIYEKLREASLAYDKEFAEMVHQTEMRMCAQFEADFALSIDALPYGYHKAMIADRYLAKRDPARWSDRIEMRHSGTVKHEHQHALASREERLAELANKQRESIASAHPAKALPATTDHPAIEDVIEGEVIQEVIAASV